MPEIDLAEVETTLFYHDPAPQGSPAVLLLHGLGVVGASWQMQLEPLAAAGYHPLAPDLPGFGRSRMRGGRWSPASAAGAMACLLERLGLPAAHVVGLSLGGTVALQMALDHPERVRSLTLVNTFARLRSRRARDWGYYLRRLALVYTLGLPVQARLVARQLFPEPGQALYREMLIQQVTQANARVYRQAMLALGMFDVRARLAQIHAPTLVVTGAADTTVAPEVQRALVEGIPGASQVVIPAAGHALTVAQPAAFNRALLDFLGGRDQSS